MTKSGAQVWCGSRTVSYWNALLILRSLSRTVSNDTVQSYI